MPTHEMQRESRRIGENLPYGLGFWVKPMRRKAAQGFTLIELLVVIAIIAILASMLLPVLGNARRSSRQVVCLGQMRQVGIGMNLYSQDFNGFVPAGVIHEGTPMQVSWDSALEPYVGSPATMVNPGGGGIKVTGSAGANLYCCPEDQIERVNQCLPRSYSRIWFTDGPYGAYIDDYAMPINTGQLGNPASLFLIAEVQTPYNIRANNWCNYIVWHIFKNVLAVPPANQFYAPNLGSWHLGGSNFLFFDGHVQSVHKAEAEKFTPYWQKN